MKSMSWNREPVHILFPCTNTDLLCITLIISARLSSVDVQISSIMLYGVIKIIRDLIPDIAT